MNLAAIRPLSNRGFKAQGLTVKNKDNFVIFDSL